MLEEPLERPPHIHTNLVPEMINGKDAGWRIMRMKYHIGFKKKLFGYDEYDFKSAVFAMVYYNFSIMPFYNLFHNKQS